MIQMVNQELASSFCLLVVYFIIPDSNNFRYVGNAGVRNFEICTLLENIYKDQPDEIFISAPLMVDNSRHLQGRSGSCPICLYGLTECGQENKYIYVKEKRIYCFDYRSRSYGTIPGTCYNH